MSKDDETQLDLLGAMVPPTAATRPAAARAEVRWAKHELEGRLGWTSTVASVEELASAARVTVALVVVEDPAPWVGVGALDVRHLALPPTPEAIDRQVSALAADARAGRRVVVMSSDEPLAAWLVGAALVELGMDAPSAAVALGGRATLGPARYLELEARASARGRVATPRDAPLFEEPEAEPPVAAALAPDRESAPSPVRAARADPDSVRAPEVGDQDAIEPDPEPTGGSGAQMDPSPEPIADPFAWANHPFEARMLGAVLGGAIGDAMGHPTEFVSSFDAIRERWPPRGVAGFELWRTEGARRFAPYTDDTQMAECVLRALLWGRDEDAGLDATMRRLAELFVTWSSHPQGGHRAPGNACLAGCRNLARGAAWHEAGGPSAGGCGSVMRAYPFGLLFHDDLARAERWSVAHSKLTHRDPIALAASAAMAIGVARIMRDEPLATVLSEMIAAACRYSPTTAEMMARALHEAQSGVEPEVTLQRLQGWAAHEAIAAAVYLVARHPDDPRAAILEGANSPGDSDSLATLAGALVGARLGVAALPPEWVREVERSGELSALALRI